MLTVRHWGFDGRARTGQLIVNRDVADPLRKVFRQLYEVRFPIRYMQLDIYRQGPELPAGGDVSGSFECRKAVPSPCGTGSGNWSNHAFGHAIDLNPRENPYVGCGMVRDPTRARYINSDAALQGDGDSGRRPCVRLDRLGLGRELDGRHEGLHALLDDRWLATSHQGGADRRS